MATVPVYRTHIRMELPLADHGLLQETLACYEDEITITAEEFTVKPAGFLRPARLTVDYILETTNKTSLRQLKSELTYLTLLNS